MKNIEVLHLNVDDGVSSMELHDTWLQLFRRRSEAAKTAAGMWQQWKDAPGGSVQADRLWARYSAFQSEYRVLAAWTDLCHTAWVFSTDGRHCRFLPSHSTAASRVLVQPREGNEDCGRHSVAGVVCSVVG
jgi:hypothetical protein